MLKQIATLLCLVGRNSGKTQFPSRLAQQPLRYKLEGYAQTRDAIVWITSSAPHLDYGISLDEAFLALDVGYESVLDKLKDKERLSQGQQSRDRMHSAYFHFAKGEVLEGKRALFEAGELFTTLRRIDGKKPSRQELGDTEHAANELDE